MALFRNNDGEKTLVIILKRDPIPIGTLLSIMKQARMEREEFIALLTSKLNKSKFHPYNFGKSTFIQKEYGLVFPPPDQWFYHLHTPVFICPEIAEHISYTPDMLEIQIYTNPVHYYNQE